MCIICNQFYIYSPIFYPIFSQGNFKYFLMLLIQLGIRIFTCVICINSTKNIQESACNNFSPSQSPFSCFIRAKNPIFISVGCSKIRFLFFFILFIDIDVLNSCSWGIGWPSLNNWGSNRFCEGVGAVASVPWGTKKDEKEWRGWWWFFFFHHVV